MDPSTPSCSSVYESERSVNEDIDELRDVQGINVWGQHQEVLEEQAFKELQIFNRNKEDGEISDGERNVKEEKQISLKKSDNQLDISWYIKRQEELKKRRDYKKTLEISEKSRNAAEKISKKMKRKRTKHPEKQKGTKRLKVEEIENVDNNNQREEIDKEEKVVKEKSEEGQDSDSDYIPSDPDSDYDPGYREVRNGSSKSKSRKTVKLKEISKVIDDGSNKEYKKRLDGFYKQLEKEMDEKPDDFEDVVIKPGFTIIAKIWNNLYGYQQEALEWMHGLHMESSGGLLGDEMGLGKTVQVIAFLYALNHSRIVSRNGRYTGLGPSIIACPSTVLHQWVRHFHEWAPEFQVAVLHQSGSYIGNRTQLIKDINKAKGILITTYQGILKFKGVLQELDWHYIILDEGHKIRNPGAKISKAVKEFRTPHRLLLTGSPMQNNLQELWSLFDFIKPGMLGSLPVFLEHFANPITQGGYANATQMQESLALSMATALKNMISPFLLRRAKADVKQEISLPNKTEQVLFCSLTAEQRDLYKGYLMSEHVSEILGRGGKNWFSEKHSRANVLKAITTLRKICNHPDIYLHELEDEDETDSPDKPIEERYGYYKHSGKMIVVSALLKIWKRQSHRVLLFTQSRAMVTIFIEFLKQQEYKFLKMDGSTPVATRQPLIDKFNTDTSYDIFVLTTRVGGLGVNLTGADRVIIYDPDWNPATDTQARERAWRIGQDKQVTIYRLLSAGTIEEKIYQRQVWKQLLSNKVLLDAKTQKCFKTSDLHDLFSFQEQIDSTPETANIFKNSRVSMEQKIKEKKKPKKVDESTIQFSDDKIEKMKQLASQIAKNISQNNFKKPPSPKTDAQIDLEEERKQKLEEREMLKQLTPTELRNYNREKLKDTEEEECNQIDDFETDISFTKALVISEKTSDLYHQAKTDKTKVDTATIEYSTLTKVFAKEPEKHKKKHKHKERIIVDNSGIVEGEKIDGLLKLEIKKQKSSKEKIKTDLQDNYVLEKLFAKKGVHTALQHDSIVQHEFKGQGSIKIHSETKTRTDLALQALRKSRVTEWRW